MDWDFLDSYTSRSRDALQSITRPWFLGYEWKQTKFRDLGITLQLQQTRPAPYFIDERRARCLADSFHAVGVYPGIKPESPTNMTMMHYEFYGKGMIVEVTNPNSDFLETMAPVIRANFLARYMREAGLERPPFYIVGGTHALLEAVR